MVRVRSNQIASDISSPTAAKLRMIGPNATRSRYAFVSSLAVSKLVRRVAFSP